MNDKKTLRIRLCSFALECPTCKVRVSEVKEDDEETSSWDECEFPTETHIKCNHCGNKFRVPMKLINSLFSKPLASAKRI